MIDVRPLAGDGDVALFLRLRNEIYPQRRLTREELEHARAGPWRWDAVARLDGAAVGVGSVGQHWVDPDGPVAFARVHVRADARGRGVGTALYRALSEEARAHGRTALYTVVPEEDEASTGYLGRRGYRCVLEMLQVALDLDAFVPRDDLSLGAGLRLAPLEPELDDAVYEASREVEAALEVGEGEAMAPLDFEAWRRRQLPPQARRDLSFAALDGNVVAGYAILEDEGDGVGDHSMTGVRPGYRGRGIATALKHAQAAAAKVAGLRELRGANAVSNAAMRHVNAKLGYRRRLLLVHLRGPLLLG